MSEHFLLPGPPALSGLRRDRLLQRLKAIDSRVDAVEADQVFLVWAERPLTEAEHTRLRALLDSPPQPARPAATPLWVVPRLGTVSPWASKATDIARNCGLALRRVERVTEFILSLKSGLLGGSKPLGEVERQALAALLHEHQLDAACLALSETPEVQARYDCYTQSAIDAQVFGAPTYLIDGEMFWGQDRLDFVAQKLNR